MTHRPLRTFPALPFVLPLMLGPVGVRAAGAQGTIVDEGTFVIERAGRPVGEESFSLRRQRLADGRAGLLLSATSSWSGSGDTYDLSVEYGQDSLAVNAQLGMRGPDERRYFVHLGDRRITVRMASTAGEAAREYPCVPRALIADDSVLTAYALLPGRAAGRVTLFFPRTSRRVAATLDDAGTERLPVAGLPRELHRYVLHLPDAEVRLWYDQGGRLTRVEFPHQQLSAVRAP